MQVTPYETAARSKASKVTGTKRSEVSPAFQLASRFPGLVAVVHCYFDRSLSEVWNADFLSCRYTVTELTTPNRDKNRVFWTVHFPDTCLAASQTQDPQSTKGGIGSKVSVRDQGASGLTRVHLVQPHWGGEGKEWGAGGNWKQKSHSLIWLLGQNVHRLLCSRLKSKLLPKYVTSRKQCEQAWIYELDPHNAA